MNENKDAVLVVRRSPVIHDRRPTVIRPTRAESLH